MFSEQGVVTPDIVIVSHGAQTAVGHEPGHGPIAERARDRRPLPARRESGCYADMTRAFCIGEAPELVRYHGLVREALDRPTGRSDPGSRGAELHRLVCELFHEHGFPTQLEAARRSPRGWVLPQPRPRGGPRGARGSGLGRNGELLAGDVLAVEPGLYRTGFGGCRLEDLVLVTEDGCELLTDYPYDLRP